MAPEDAKWSGWTATRFQGDDEVPSIYLMGEPRAKPCPSRSPAGPAPRRRRQDGALRAAHLLQDHLQVHLQDGGRTSYRGLVQVQDGAAHSDSTVKCDALLVDTVSRSDTYPYVDIREDDVEMGHEASVSKISEDQLFYLMSRGMTEDEAAATIVRGFVEPIARASADGVRRLNGAADRAADGGGGRLRTDPPAGARARGKLWHHQPTVCDASPPPGRSNHTD